MNKTEELLAIVRKANFQEIESARDRVTFSDVGTLAAAYPTLENWEQKAALINLVQDHLDPRFRSMMLDFLRAPDNKDDEASSSDDVIPLTKAIALCHLDENFDDFMVYYNDRRLLQERVHDYVRDAPRAKETPPPPKGNSGTTAQQQKNTPQNSPWQIFGVTALIVGIGLLLITANNWHTLQKYRREGVTVEARVTGKSKQDDETCIGVSFFDKDLLDGGDLHLTEICKFVTNDIWDNTRRGAHEKVVFLPKDPQHEVIFAASLESDQSASFVIGGGIVIVGAFALVWDQRKNKQGK